MTIGMKYQYLIDRRVHVLNRLFSHVKYHLGHTNVKSVALVNDRLEFVFNDTVTIKRKFLNTFNKISDTIVDWLHL